MLDFLGKRPDGVVRYVKRDLHLYDGLGLLLKLCLEILNLLHELFDRSFSFIGRQIVAAAFGVVGMTITTGDTGTGLMMLVRLRLLPDRGRYGFHGRSVDSMVYVQRSCALCRILDCVMNALALFDGCWGGIIDILESSEGIRSTTWRRLGRCVYGSTFLHSQCTNGVPCVLFSFAGVGPGRCRIFVRVMSLGR